MMPRRENPKKETRIRWKSALVTSVAFGIILMCVGAMLTGVRFSDYFFLIGSVLAFVGLLALAIVDSRSDLLLSMKTFFGASALLLLGLATSLFDRDISWLISASAFAALCCLFLEIASRRRRRKSLD